MTPQIDINFSAGVWQQWQTAKDIVKQNVNSLTNSLQQVGQSFKETATTTKNQAIDTVSTTLEQAKGSLAQSWQTAEQIKNTTSGVVQNAINASVNDWLAQHPIFLRLFQIIGWAANHPIISLVFMLFGLALIWSIIKAMIRLIETASWSIFQVPLKLIRALIQVIFLSLTKFSRFAIQQITGNKTTDNIPTLLPTNCVTVSQDKQQRLAEISSRLEVIQQEQQKLLQEAASLISTDMVEMKIAEVKFSKK